MLEKLYHHRVALMTMIITVMFATMIPAYAQEGPPPDIEGMIENMEVSIQFQSVVCGGEDFKNVVMSLYIPQPITTAETTISVEGQVARNDLSLWMSRTGSLILSTAENEIFGFCIVSVFPAPVFDQPGTDA